MEAARLAAALYDPVWISAIIDSRDFALAMVAFVLLTVWNAAPWIAVLVTVMASVAANAMIPGG